ncbi:MAG: type II secretion system protein [Burkholderiales bacterium]
MNIPPPTARCRGLTLVEVLVFIVIIGVAAFALLRSFGSLLPREPTGAQITRASLLAQERMELILGRYTAAGFSGVNDPCIGGTPPPICTPPSGYAFSPAPTLAGVWNGNPISDYKLVTVAVSFNGTQLAQENMVLANY